MSDTILEVDREIQAARDKLEQLLRNKAIIEASRKELSPQQKYAIALHDALCRHNHTDGCGWMYDVDSTTQIHNWNGAEHQRWFTKAGMFRTYCSDNRIPTDDAVKVLEYVQKM